MSPNVALIGLGNMGTPMSRRLVDAGSSVRGYDLVPEARERLRDGGGTPADTAPEAAREATAVILMLPNSDVVDAVADELLEAGAIGEGTLVVDMSSSEPARTRVLAERLADAGVAFADAPVSGGVRGAERGSLTIMLGARDADRERAHALLAPLGRVVDCGDVGAGHAIKALNNLLSATHLWATSEAIEAGRRFGLDPEVMLSVFNGSSGKSGSTENKWPNFILPETFDSGFGLRLMLKDMRIATNLAAQVGMPSRLGEDAVDLWAEAAEGLASDADHTRVAEWIAARASPDGGQGAQVRDE
ncbi:NAD(P)-dependent oxidoreductase [Agrococcus jenensis]|uniref:3-hydroxyisobutyrate dehydrogenase n=1 Tax=Agrococcus jenensis TaxID=46353 RepID=A0A3N2ARV2_9MICO|nr:NAD(P)-dependent oxidoreductase [Agrococcus jenensis]ROR65780.1 3-hydroxyisobutyrate dehydrogenase [Agrococcus jenensis]